MANVITINRTATFFELLSALLWLNLAIIQKAAQQTTQAIKTVFIWLNSLHEFGFLEDPQDQTDSVKMSGWKFLAFCFLSCFVAVVLSIDWDSVFC